MAYEPLTIQQYQSAQKAGFSPNQIIANEKQRQQQQNQPIQQPTTDNPQYSSNNTLLDAGNTTANFLGIQKAGQGLASSARVATGEINNTGNQEGQMAHDQQKLIDAIHAQTNPAIKQHLETVLKNYYGQGSAAPTQAQVDPGTQLSNKEVLGSFGNVALTAATAGIGTPESLAGKTAVGGALGYGYDVANAANNNQDKILKPGLGTATGALLPFASKLTGTLSKAVLGVTTGAGKDVIQRAIDNPNAVLKAINSSTPETKEALVSTAKEALNSFIQERNSQFGQGLSKMVASEPVNKQNLLDSFTKTLDKFHAGATIKDGAMTFGDAALSSSEQKSVQNVHDIIKGWQNVTPQGMETLRQRIGSEMDNFKFANNGKDNAILGAVKSSLTNDMKSKIPGYSDLLKNYGTQTDLAKSVANQLGLKGNATPQTQLNKVMKLFKKDPSVIKQLTQVMGQKDANEFLNNVSGTILSSWLPDHAAARGVGEAVLGGAAKLGGAAINPLTVGAGLAAQSPRIVGTGAALAGKVAKTGVGKTLNKAAIIAASKGN